MKFNIYYLLLLVLLILPVGVLAAPATFTPLVGIPGIDQYTGPGSLNLYINALYRLSISIAALLAVIKIVAAGAKYMLTDIVPAKEEAKKDIQGALIGLLIVIGAIIILNTVNSDLTKLNLTVPVQEITQGQALEKALADAQKSKADKMCELANISKGERCTTEVCESGECTSFCKEQKGIYFKGSDYGWISEDLDYYDKCTYIAKPNPGNMIEIERTGDNKIDKQTCEGGREDYRWETDGGLYFCIYKGNTKLSSIEEAELRSKLCQKGYTCEVKLCAEEPSWFRGYYCNSWCSGESGSNMTYSKELDACYINTR